MINLKPMAFLHSARLIALTRHADVDGFRRARRLTAGCQRRKANRLGQRRDLGQHDEALHAGFSEPNLLNGGPLPTKDLTK
jgi:hypothetical protein